MGTLLALESSGVAVLHLTHARPLIQFNQASLTAGDCYAGLGTVSLAMRQVRRCAVLCCAVLCCAVLCCAVLCLPCLRAFSPLTCRPSSHSPSVPKPDHHHPNHPPLQQVDFTVRFGVESNGAAHKSYAHNTADDQPGSGGHPFNPLRVQRGGDAGGGGCSADGDGGVLRFGGGVGEGVEGDEGAVAEPCEAHRTTVGACLFWGERGCQVLYCRKLLTGMRGHAGCSPFCVLVLHVVMIRLAPQALNCHKLNPCNPATLETLELKASHTGHLHTTRWPHLTGRSSLTRRSWRATRA